MFNDWKCSRDSKSPPSDLTMRDVGKLNYWIPRFINEAQRNDGCPHPLRTINQLLAAIQCFMLSENYTLPKFLDRSNAVFHPIHNAGDAVYHSLHASGIGSSVITEEEETKLWVSGILGIENPKSLLRAVFFYIGKQICLRGCEEQR